MASDLYETLDIPKNASAEQIRKAYKRKALQTHPDRLPPGATPEDKAASEEMFRKVNNAYEVLNDAQNRRVYDLHGTWPPPEPGSVPLHRTNGEGPYRSPSDHHHHHHSSRSFPFAHPFSRRFRDPSSFVFTDPFTLFDSIFDDADAHHSSSQYYNYNNAGPSRAENPFEGIERMHAEFEHLWNHSLPSNPPGGFFAMPPHMDFPFHDPTSFSDGPRRGWASNSFITTTVNGVTQTIHKQRHWDGTEHVTRTYPDGREVRTINGVEQPSSRGYIAQHPGSAEVHHRAHPGSTSQSHVAGSRTPRTAPPSYTSQPRANGYANPPAEPEYSRRHDHRHPETRPIIPEPYNSGAAGDNSRKRWWRGNR